MVQKLRPVATTRFRLLPLAVMVSAWIRNKAIGSWKPRPWRMSQRLWIMPWSLDVDRNITSHLLDSQSLGKSHFDHESVVGWIAMGRFPGLVDK